MQVSSAFLFILLVVSTTGQRFDRHDFGYVLQENQQLYVSTATAKMIYYYKLPGRLDNVSLADLNCTAMESNNERGRAGECRAVGTSCCLPIGWQQLGVAFPPGCYTSRER